MSKINLRNIACEICEVFEGWLEDNDIIIPNEERNDYIEDLDEDEIEDVARLFGSDYYELEDIATDELSLYFTGKIPNLPDFKTKSESIESHVKVIIDHFDAFVSYAGYELTKGDKRNFLNHIYNIFKKTDFLIKSMAEISDKEIEFETDICDGYGLPLNEEEKDL